MIVNQVNDVYNTKDENHIPYKDLVTRFLNYFHEYHLENISRNNMYAYAMTSTTLIAPIEIDDEESILKIKKAR